MRNTKGIENAKAKVAAKYGLGSTLVTGHKGAYWEQAMEEYATSRISELEAENKQLEIKVLDMQDDRSKLREAEHFIDLQKLTLRDLEAENKRLRDEHRWIPVTERLPEESKRYLCYTPHFEDDPLIACIYEDGKWYEESFDITEWVTHWQSIQPPKEQ